jgi:hypothetical protein
MAVVNVSFAMTVLLDPYLLTEQLVNVIFQDF